MNKEAGYQVNEVRHMLTYDCNFLCLHCYLKGGEHPEIRPVDFTPDQADAFYGYFQPESVSATGGEPTLKPQLVKTIAKSIGSYGGELELVTNGVLLNQNFVEELGRLNHHLSFQISLDGDEAYHDYLRQHLGAYHRAMEAIQLTSKMGYKTKARMTVTEKNYSQIPRVIAALDQFDRDNIRLVMRIALNTGRALQNELGFDFPLSDELMKFQGLAKKITIGVTDRCGYCTDSLTVDPLGDIYPCCYFTFNPKYRMGSMLKDPGLLEVHPEFAHYVGKCLAMDHFNTSTDTSPRNPDTRCSKCITDDLLNERN